MASPNLTMPLSIPLNPNHSGMFPSLMFACLGTHAHQWDGANMVTISWEGTLIPGSSTQPIFFQSSWRILGISPLPRNWVTLQNYLFFSPTHPEKMLPLDLRMPPETTFFSWLLSQGLRLSTSLQVFNTEDINEFISKVNKGWSFRWENLRALTPLLRLSLRKIKTEYLLFQS